MLEFLKEFDPVTQALLATLFTWFLTALGSAGVFFHRNVNRKVLDSMLGLAAGVMIAASYWSLLAPAIELSEGKDLPSWVPPTIGFLSGGIFLFLIDKVLPHLHPLLSMDKAEGIKTNWQRSVLLVLAITMHNIPEGLAVGVAFGAASLGMPETTIASAVALAIGIGLQNFPEGVAVSMPLRSDGMRPAKAFWYGQLSGIVEPIAGVAGAAFVILAVPVLPYALAFAAGAMIYVVVEELIPESQSGGNTDLATIFTMAGFTIMMILDVSLS
jgi:zinc transporter, ZIP family